MPANDPTNGEQRHGLPRQDEPLDPISEAEESLVVETALASLRRLQKP